MGYVGVVLKFIQSHILSWDEIMVVSAAGGVRFGQECSAFSLHILGDSVPGGVKGT